VGQQRCQQSAWELRAKPSDGEKKKTKADKIP
jgi:hypothetical protein